MMPALAAGATHHASWHPEWGPYPPVAPYTRKPLPGHWTHLPMIFPVMGPCWYHNDYGAPRGAYRHTGIDIKAAKFTPIVAPISGTLGMKTMTFWIWSPDGWGVLGTHLNNDDPGTHDRHGDRDVMFAPNVYPGEHVVAGQFLGYVGQSGDATGPHLHFEVYAPGSGTTMSRLRNPMPSLHLSQRISHPVSTLPPVVGKPGHGKVDYVGCLRKDDEAKGTFTMILTDVKRSDGVDHVVTSIRYQSFKISPEAVAAAGGWQALNHLKPEQRISAVTDDAVCGDSLTADSLRVVDSL